MKKRIIGGIGITLTILIIGVFCFYKINIGKPKNDPGISNFTIESGQTTREVLKNLEENKIIRSANVAKVYMKLHKINTIQAGVYDFSTSLSLKEVLNKLSTGGSIHDDITITFVEGKRMTYFAKMIAENFDYQEEEIYALLKDKEYLNSLIDEYWFITEDILNEELYYPLEGYLFPDTYSFRKEATLKEIFKVLLDSMESKLDPYKEEIESSGKNVHEILTLASMVELEASTKEDKEGVASVFTNRIHDGWTLGSDVTTYYAFQKDFDTELSYVLYNTCNPYNTRSTCFTGLPVGPICNPGVDAILASINPNESEYYYFVADKYKKTYFAKNETEFYNTIQELKNNNLWYTY